MPDPSAHPLTAGEAIEMLGELDCLCTDAWSWKIVKQLRAYLATLPDAPRGETEDITPNAEGWRVCVGCPNACECEAKGCQWPIDATVSLRGPGREGRGE